VASKVVPDLRADPVFRTGNISAVMVTASLGPFDRREGHIDVTVSALDEATSLQGGTLIMTPLKGPDGVDYAVAQGAVSVGGVDFSAPGGVQGGTTTSARKNHPTVGRISGGAVVVREALGEIQCNGQLRLQLIDADPVTAQRITDAINSHFPGAA